MQVKHQLNPPLKSFLVLIQQVENWLVLEEAIISHCWIWTTKLFLSIFPAVPQQGARREKNQLLGSKQIKKLAEIQNKVSMFPCNKIKLRKVSFSSHLNSVCLIVTGTSSSLNPPAALTDPRNPGIKEAQAHLDPKAPNTSMFSTWISLQHQAGQTQPLLLRSHPSETLPHSKISITERRKWGCVQQVNLLCQRSLLRTPQSPSVTWEGSGQQDSDTESMSVLWPPAWRAKHSAAASTDFCPTAVREESKHRKLPQMAPAIGRTHKRYWTENTKHKQNDLFEQKYKHRWINLS